MLIITTWADSWVTPIMPANTTITSKAHHSKHCKAVLGSPMTKNSDQFYNVSWLKNGAFLYLRYTESEYVM